MNLLSSKRNLSNPLFCLISAVILLGALSLTNIYPVTAQSDPLPNLDPFDRYGFTVSGFNIDQKRIILKTLDAYAQALGGPEKLRFIIVTFYGQKGTITYDEQMQGANSEIRLSPTVFSIQKASVAKYSCYAAQNEEDHAKIVIGHEIGHVLMLAMKQQTGVDWAENYEQQVRRYWKVIKGNHAPEEEAVTQLSLAVLGRDYSFSLEEDEFESNYIRLWEIHRWTANILNALQMMK